MLSTDTVLGWRALRVSPQVAGYTLLGAGGALFVSLFLPWYWLTDKTEEYSPVNETGWSIMSSLDVLLCILAALSTALGLAVILMRRSPLPLGLGILLTAVAGLLFAPTFYHLVAPHQVVFPDDQFDLDSRYSATIRAGVPLAVLALAALTWAHAVLAAKAWLDQKRE